VHTQRKGLSAEKRRIKEKNKNNSPEKPGVAATGRNN
jgi:hypothetical protein